MTNTVSVSGYGNVLLKTQPDQCPVCHHKISPTFLTIRMGGRRFKGVLQVVYICPSSACDELFISYFGGDSSGTQFSFIQSRPVEPKPVRFSDSIIKISPAYCDIYTEAHKAEELGLTQICGVGYRKALEFLIKDYLKGIRPDDQASIESKMLGPCIDNYVTDHRIKDVAKRAAWLGNDETHYQRRWLDKDLSDLKILIQLVNHWIEAEHLTEEVLKSMPGTSRA
jgi:hypothetical protein